MLQTVSPRSVPKIGTPPYDSNRSPEVLLTERETAEYLRLSVRTLQKFRFEGRGPAYHKFGKAIRYNMNDLSTYTASSRINMAGA